MEDKTELVLYRSIVTPRITIPLDQISDEEMIAMLKNTYKSASLWTTLTDFKYDKGEDNIPEPSTISIMREEDNFIYLAANIITNCKLQRLSLLNLDDMDVDTIFGDGV